MRSSVSHRSNVFAYTILTGADKHFHSHPELSYQEKETAAKVAEHLNSLNAYEVIPGIGGHGVAAVLKNGAGRTILLRADMDGLPVEEKTELPYASKARMKDLDGVEKPVMHACGHDIHITGLLSEGEVEGHFDLSLSARRGEGWRCTGYG
jgi:metal-dependent amidase/aminoacylase/carboxypeptidase family protein